MKDILTIIIPTWNNPQFLNPCVLSIQRSGVLDGFANLIIVNNGDSPISDGFKGLRNIKVIEAGKNLGWEGGLKAGLEASKSPFVCFLNDDTHLIPSQISFFERMLSRFIDPKVGAVGPITTVAAGWHSIYQPQMPAAIAEVPFLIFFCVVVRRQHLDMVGGIDTTLPGGDDFDLSIRLRKAGLKLLLDPSAFIIHHGFKTGERVHGGPQVHGGWNSKQMSDATNNALIRKHGFRNFFETLNGQAKIYNSLDDSSPFGTDEHELIRREVPGFPGWKIAELGCGGKKVYPHSIGVDHTPRGQVIDNIRQEDKVLSVADVVADVSAPLPFDDGEFNVVVAQHIIEHCVDLVGTLKEWVRILKPEGYLVLSTPNEDIINGITLNPEHCHAFSPKSLTNLVSLLGLKEEKVLDPANGLSFISIFQKLPVLQEVV